MNKIKYTITMFAVGAGLLFSSCDKWLTVEPIDKMDEEKIFSSKEGFVKAINGVYLDMISSQLYGRSFRFLDVLAQRYYIGTGHKLEKLSQFTYTEQGVRETISGVWEQTYAEIANCNRLLEKLEEKKEMLGESEYNLLKGEALGLRAMLHFDILRLWAPSPLKATAGNVYVPYYKNINVTGEPLLTVARFVDELTADLEAAEDALKYDPTRTNMSGNRNLRFNYYAVKLMQARVYQYRGTGASRIKAYQAAIQVINNANFDRVFPFVDPAMATGGGGYSGNPDRIFYSELIFCLQNMNRKKIYEEWFIPTLDDNTILGQTTAVVDDLYAYSGDYRKVSMWISALKNGKDMKILAKYDKVDDSNNTIRTIAQSVLRKAEFYLIAADCAPSESAACQYLNMLQKARGYQDIYLTKPGQDVESAVRSEYSREFYGEGQYFFYLKMKDVKNLDKGNGDGAFTMTDLEYVLPLPDSEINSR